MGSREEPVATQAGPHIVSNEIANSLEEPLSRDELRKRAEVRPA